MAEEFINQGGVCSGTWWNPSRNELFPGSLSPCSGAAGDVTGLCWLVESNTASLTSSASSDWTQAFLGGVDSDGKRASNQTDFNSNSDIMHESGSSDSSQIHSGWAPGLTGSFAPEPAQDHEDSSPMSAFKNQTDLPAQTSEAYANHDISSSFGYPSTMKNFLLEQPPPPLLEGRLDLPEEDYTSYLVPSYRQSCSDDLSSASSGKLSSLLNPNTSSLPKPYWNSSMSALDDTQAGLLASPQSALASGSADEKLNRSNSIAKVNGSTKKKVNPEPALKRPRIETPSPLPTFKVRKEKLGDRITALQQLVSPFGKTDTASVLHEAIEYIKFLHDQVNALSTLYRKNDGAPSQQHQQAPTDRTLEDSEGPKMDLRSRGLCLVPTSSTFPVACQAPNDFWTPTFGGSFL